MIFAPYGDSYQADSHGVFLTNVEGNEAMPFLCSAQFNCVISKDLTAYEDDNFICCNEIPDWLTF